MAEEVVRRLGHFGAGLPIKPPHSTNDHHVMGSTSLEDSLPHARQIQHSFEAAHAGFSTEAMGPAHVGVESLASILVDTFKSSQAMEDLPQSSKGDMPRPSAHETIKLLYMADTGSMYPFTSLWKPGTSVDEICLAFPNDETFEQYVSVRNQ